MNCKFCKEELKGRADSYLGAICMSYKNNHRFSIHNKFENIECLSFRSDFYAMEFCNNFTKETYSVLVKNGFDWNEYHFDNPIVMSNSLDYYLNLIDNLKHLG